jgi:hypothetical protein
MGQWVKTRLSSSQRGTASYKQVKGDFIMAVTTGSQPSPTTTFSVFLDLEVLNLENRDNDGIPSSSVLSVGKPFEVWLSFKGSGTVWDFLESIGAEYRITYYADQQFGVPNNINLGTKTGNLISGGGTYSDPDTTLSATINSAGLYELSAIVTFQIGSFVLKGITGFAEGLVVQTY